MKTISDIQKDCCLSSWSQYLIVHTYHKRLNEYYSNKQNTS
jgi:hypothetical protein